ncbi:MAG: hypothetical protein DRI71_05235 [Bacteroidetes bacterium]|nr:MAG: hypothetical protein DRI71_05235 [Bacteroidota bacterium]
MLKALFSTLLLGSLLIFNSYGQEKDCKVLLNGLDELYTGGCKKGLAHGEGTAEGSLGEYKGNFRKGFPNGFGKLNYKRTIVEGSYYEGDWRRGNRHGEGTYYFARDSITTGFWEDDIYLGKYPYPYKVLSSQALPRNKFTKTTNRSLPSIEIQFKRNGVRTMGDIVSFDIQTSSGSEIRQDNSVIIENVEFPFEGRITMQVMNRMKANVYSANFAFIINETADWMITLDY